jgi:hypothetical protein
MTLEPDAEKNTAHTRDNVPAKTGNDADAGLPPVVAPSQPPQAPAPQSPTPENSEKWWKDKKFVLECLGFVVLCGYTWFACLQWLQIRYTNGLTARALDGNDKTLSLTLGKMQGQTDATNRLAKDQEIANGNAIGSDRPWIGGWIQVTGFTVGQSPSAICTFLNAGRRPAFMEESTCGTVVDKYDLRTINKEPEKSGRGILLPGQTTIAPVHFFMGGSPNFFQNGDRMTSAFLNAFDSGDIHIKVVANATYRDVRTGVVYHSRFCQRYLPSMYGRSAGFYECNDENRIE